MRWLLLLMALYSTPCSADEYSLRTGSGVSKNDSKSAMYSVSWENKFSGDLEYKFDGGLWTDSQAEHANSLFASGMLGLRPGDTHGLNASALAGYLVLGHPDALLGAPFAFTEEASLGYNWVSVGYKHISNAGLFSPNVGRDYVFINLTGVL